MEIRLAGAEKRGFSSISFFNRPLSAAEVLRLYSSAKACKTTGNVLADGSFHKIAIEKSQASKYRVFVDGLQRCSTDDAWTMGEGRWHVGPGPTSAATIELAKWDTLYQQAGLLTPWTVQDAAADFDADKVTFGK